MLSDKELVVDGAKAPQCITLTNKELNWLKNCNIGEIVKVEKLENALTNNVFLLTCSSVQKFVFKRLNQQARSLSDRKSELLLQKIASDKNLTPNVIDSCKFYKLQEYIEGKTLNNSLVNNSLIKQLALQLQIVHQLPVTKGITSQRLQFELLQLKQLLQKSIDENRFEHYFNLAKILDESSARDIVCHGDLSLNNLLQTTDKQIKILDWEYGVIACAAYDLAFCCCINELAPLQYQLLIEDYYRLNNKRLSISLTTLKAESALYLSFFTYLNELWAVCFVDAKE